MRTKLFVWIAIAAPMLWLIWRAMTDQLGANPVESIIRSLGFWTLVMLCVTLAMRPMTELTHSTLWIQYRRTLGLTTFFYGLVHFVAWTWFEHDAVMASMLDDILKRPYLAFGAAALLAMIPLAVTSNRIMIKRLGVYWKRLHRLVYAVAIAGLIHYYFHKLGKNDLAPVMPFALVIGLLLGYRVVHWFRKRAR